MATIQTFEDFIKYNQTVFEEGETDPIGKSNNAVQEILKTDSQAFIKSAIEYFGIEEDKANKIFKASQQLGQEFREKQNTLKQLLAERENINTLSNLTQTEEYQKEEQYGKMCALYSEIKENLDKKIESLNKQTDEIKEKIILKSFELLESGTKFQNLSSEEQSMQKKQLAETWALILIHSATT